MQSQVVAVGRTTGVAGARGSSRSNSRSSSRQQGLMLWQLNRLLSALCVLRVLYPRGMAVGSQSDR
jgi:hypothetical protein